MFPLPPSGEPLDFQGLKEFFKTKSAYGHHISGTCAMTKVVDSRFRVLQHLA